MDLSKMTKSLKHTANTYKGQIATTALIEHMKDRLQSHIMMEYKVFNIKPLIKVKVGEDRKISNVHVYLPSIKPMVDPLLPKIMEEGSGVDVTPIRDDMATYTRKLLPKKKWDSQEYMPTVGVKSFGPSFSKTLKKACEKATDKASKKPPKKNLWSSVVERCKKLVMKPFSSSVSTQERLNEDVRNIWRKKVEPYVLHWRLLSGLITSKELEAEEQKKLKKKRWYRRLWRTE